MQRCITDLVSILALPAIWREQDPPQIVHVFIDGLRAILDLDLLYVRLAQHSDDVSQWLRAPGEEHLESVTQTLAGFGGDLAEWPHHIIFGSRGSVFLAPLRLGLYPGMGVMAAGSRRRGFPSHTEQLLLSVAANQLVLALQEAQLRAEERRTAQELDRQVARRTAELAAANTKLRKEVDERQSIEAQLRSTERELNRVARSSSLELVTAAVAHEVNQPLAGIVNNATICLKLLSAGAPNVEHALEVARRMLRDGQRAADIIARLRTLYTRTVLQRDLLDLNDIAREVVSLFLPELQENRVIVHHELAPDLPPVRGDRIQLQQVILNLLRNASDAMKTVEERPRDLTIRTESGASQTVRLSVSDAGIGFTPEMSARLFEPFYTTKRDGMGIGLSVSRSIVEAHQGRLWAIPNAGAGATFVLCLPQ